MRHIIVGIDPGISTAYAAIDLDGKFVFSSTLKEADADRIVSEIVKIGVPSMIASDVSPAPSFVQKISARFNVRTFIPERVMGEKEKGEIAGETKNLHERDALAAAVKCYRDHANRLRQIGLLETHLEKDMLKHLVMQGYPLRAAMLMLEKKEDVRNEKQGRASGKEMEKKKDDELVSLAQENVNLRKALDSERRRSESLEAELGKTKSARHYELGKDAEVRKLRLQVEKMGWAIRRLRKKSGR